MERDKSLDQKILFGQLRTFHLFSHPDRKHPPPDHLRLGFFLTSPYAA